MKQTLISLTQNYLTKLALDIEYGGTVEGIHEENELFRRLLRWFGYDLENNPHDMQYCNRATDEERALYILEIIIPKI